MGIVELLSELDPFSLAAAVVLVIILVGGIGYIIYFVFVYILHEG